MEKRDLKDYIVKLNDRNIQRQRETGFTLYAIWGSIVFCVFYLIDNIEIPFGIYTNNKFLNVAVFSANAIFIISLFYFSYGTATRRQTLTKIFPYKRPFNIDISDYPFFILYLTISILNFWLLGQQQNTWHKIFLWIFMLLTFLNVLSPFVIKLFGNLSRRRKKKKGHTIEEFDFTFFNKKVIRIFSIIFLSYATILSVYWFFVAFKIHFCLNSKQIAAISKYLVIYFAFLFLIKKAMEIKSKEHDNNQLEDFEKEIFFENISNEDIAKRYEKDYDGIPFSKWITEKQLEIMDFFENKRQDFLAQNLLLINVDKIDMTALPYEFTGRLQDIINNQANILTETIDFVQRISNAFNDLKNFSSLNEEEVDRLNYVQNYLNQLINSLNIQYNYLSAQIESRQGK